MGDDAATKICHKCNEPVVGERVTALGHSWHKSHFTCAVCNTELGGVAFYEHNGQPYCERDHHELFSPKCAACKQPIVGQIVNALGNTWHAEHFVCAECQKPFADGRFRRKDDKVYCIEDHTKLFGTKCAQCDVVIEGSYMSALGKQYHSDCFACNECNVPFKGQGFYERDGMPYCKQHSRKPAQPTYPTQPAYPTHPTQPAYPTHPTHPAYPTHPTQPAHPAYPTHPGVSPSASVGSSFRDQAPSVTDVGGVGNASAGGSRIYSKPNTSSATGCRSPARTSIDSLSGATRQYDDAGALVKSISSLSLHSLSSQQSLPSPMVIYDNPGEIRQSTPLYDTFTGGVGGNSPLYSTFNPNTPRLAGGQSSGANPPPGNVPPPVGRRPTEVSEAPPAHPSFNDDQVPYSSSGTRKSDTVYDVINDPTKSQPTVSTKESIKGKRSLSNTFRRKAKPGAS